MGGGKGSSKAPPPIDPGESMGEYLFGKGFSSQYQGITDPRLQERLIGAERTYRPQYTALELADIGVMARGIEGGTANPEYARLEAELAGLRAGQEVSGSRTKEDIEAAAAKLYPNKKRSSMSRGRSSSDYKFNKEQAAKREAYISSIGDPGQDRAARIAQIETQLEGMSPTLGATPGLFDLLEEQSTRAGALQREQLQLQRESDVGALQEFAPQVVEAYREADPYSTGLAEEASAQAMDPSMRNRGKELLDEKMRAASAAEQELNKVGMSLSDLNPTEQEAILSGRGMEFASSTGELSPLEQRRAQQSARQAAQARGRGIDQSAVYGEMQARMAEELNKQEREIALGAGLLGQESQMRLNRLGQGAGTLGQSEAMLAQRRAEELQRIQLGSGLIGQANQQLQGAFGMNRQMAGDVGMTILGRPSSAIGLGGQMLGQAQQGAAGPMGPQLFDPNVGINMALQQRGQDVTFQGMQAQAKAAGQAGIMGAVGGIAQGLGTYAACWVAREVYGIDNPKWLEFREWMLNDAPSWLRNLYLKYGERFAKFISNKPLGKSIIRKWMNTKIK